MGVAVGVAIVNLWVGVLPLSTCGCSSGCAIVNLWGVVPLSTCGCSSGCCHCQLVGVAVGVAIVNLWV